MTRPIDSTAPLATPPGLNELISWPASATPRATNSQPTPAIAAATPTIDANTVAADAHRAPMRRCNASNSGCAMNARNAPSRIPIPTGATSHSTIATAIIAAHASAVACVRSISLRGSAIPHAGCTPRAERVRISLAESA